MADGSAAEAAADATSSSITIDVIPPSNFILDKVCVCVLISTFVKNILYMREQISETFDDLEHKFGESKFPTYPPEVNTSIDNAVDTNSCTKRRLRRENVKAIKFVSAVNSALRAMHEVCMCPAIIVNSLAISFGTTVTTSKECYCLNFNCLNPIVSNSLNSNATRMRDQMAKVLIRNIISVWSQNIRFPIKKRMKSNIFFSMRVNDTMLIANSSEMVSRYFTARTVQQQPHVKAKKAKRIKMNSNRKKNLHRLIHSIDINLEDNSGNDGNFPPPVDPGGWLVPRKGIRNLPKIK